MVMAMITFCTLALIRAIMAMASRIAGMAISPSMMRIRMASRVRLYPLSSPITSPRPVLSTATVKPTSSEMREP